MTPKDQPDSELPDKVDKALDALWKGKSGEFDRLVVRQDGAELEVPNDGTNVLPGEKVDQTIDSTNAESDTTNSAEGAESEQSNG